MKTLKATRWVRARRNLRKEAVGRNNPRIPRKPAVVAVLRPSKLTPRLQRAAVQRREIKRKLSKPVAPAANLPRKQPAGRAGNRRARNQLQAARPKELR
jgi:hypothetical protein